MKAPAMTTEETRARIKQQAADLRAEIEAREQRRREAEATPPAYLSHSAGFWRVIVQGLPICADKRTAAEATAATTAYSVKLAPVFWDGDSATWKPCEGVTA
jgi:anti-sigma-K factor RskA